MDEGGGGAEEAENACLDALHALTSVRALLVGGLHSGAFQSTIVKSAKSKQQPFACIPVTSRCCDDLDMPTHLLAGRSLQSQPAAVMPALPSWDYKEPSKPSEDRCRLYLTYLGASRVTAPPRS